MRSGKQQQPILLEHGAAEPSEITEVFRQGQIRQGQQVQAVEVDIACHGLRI
jgi:hypothetical protein